MPVNDFNNVKDVKVVINLNKASGILPDAVPLILTVGAGQEEYTEYSGVGQMVDRYTTSSNAYKMATKMLMQDNPPSKFAVMQVSSSAEAVAGLSKVVTYNWRQLITTISDVATIKEIADYIETVQGKCFFASVDDVSDMATLTSGKYDRTAVVIYSEVADYPQAAIVGATAAKAAGSVTYKNLRLKGVTPQAFVDTTPDAIHQAGALTVLEKAGDIVTSEGKAVSGEYIDIVDTKDYLVSQIEYRCQKLLNNRYKVPYDNNGIALLEAEVVSVLQNGYSNGMIATNDDGLPDYTVTFAGRNEVDPADRSSRVYNGGTFTFGLSGAIHTAQIVGEIII